MTSFTTGDWPAIFEGETLVVDLAAGLTHACAVDEGQNVWCWGANDFGELGVDHLELSSTNIPLVIADFTGAVQVTAGTDHTCALDGDGAVWCWGSNNNGRLGVGDPELNRTPRPQRLTGLSDVVDIAAGATHTCARRRDRTVWCWGNNRMGQLGLGLDTLEEDSPQQAALTGAAQLVCGENHSCVRLADHSIRCFGTNAAGQLGDGGLAGIASDDPVAVYGIDDGFDIAAGDNHNCVIRRSGEVYYWGNGNLGQLGTGTDTSEDTPVRSILECP